MNANFRNFAIWIIIGLLLIALFQMFSNQSGRKASNDISYSDFKSAVDSGTVESVDHFRQPHRRHLQGQAELPDLRPL